MDLHLFLERQLEKTMRHGDDVGEFLLGNSMAREIEEPDIDAGFAQCGCLGAAFRDRGMFAERHEIDHPQIGHGLADGIYAGSATGGQTGLIVHGSILQRHVHAL